MLTDVEISNNDLSLSKSDLWMAAGNVMLLGGLAYGYNLNALVSGSTEIGKRVAFVFAPLMASGLVLSSWANWSMLPKDASLLRKIISFPCPIYLFFNGSVSLFMYRAKEVFSLYTVAQHTLPKLTTCAKNFTARPLRALASGAVHALNLATGIFSAYISFGLLDSSRFFREHDDMARLTNPELNPKKVEDAAVMLVPSDEKVGPVKCPTDYPDLHPHIKKFCDSVCSLIKSRYTDVAAKVNENLSPLVTAALGTLITAKKTLLSHYKC